MTENPSQRALIVDDSKAMRSILRRIVAGIGFETTEAGHGQEALHQLEAATATGQVPELCLIDWNMPVMDGYTFITEVRKRPEWRHITLMMVTTESEQGQIVRALAAGAHEYVIKPFTPDAIVEKLELLGLVHKGVLA